MSTENLYKERDIMGLDVHGNLYTNHVCAMTRENLDSKSDIAAELAHRDMIIDVLANDRDAMLIDGNIVTKEQVIELMQRFESAQSIIRIADGARVEKSEGNAGEEKKWLNQLYTAVGEYDIN